MEETRVIAPGMFCWSEVGTLDVETAKRFYEALFGWEMQDTPSEGLGGYTMLRKQGAEIGGLYELTAEQRAQNIPPHWIGYIRVESTDETTARVEPLGGTVVLGPADVGDFGRMAVIRDPSGAVVALWEAKSEMGSAGPGGPGTPVWFELVSSRRGDATAFYSALLGWELQTWPGGVDYVLFRTGETSAAGAAIAPSGVPSHWMIYFEVADVDEVANTAAARGGRVVEEPHDVPSVGRFAIVADHAGAMLGLMKPEAGT